MRRGYHDHDARRQALIIQHLATKPGGVQKGFNQTWFNIRSLYPQYFIAVIQVEIPLFNGWKRSQQGANLTDFFLTGYIGFIN
jgi:hypothetical protein